MDNWVSIVVVIGIALAVALVRERRRVSGVESLIKTKGLTRVFPVPDGGPPLAGDMVAHVTIRGARIWGMVLTGIIDDLPVTIAEHESAEPGRDTGVWATVVIWPVPGATSRIVMQRGRGSRVLADAAKAMTHPIRDAVREAMGVHTGPDHLTVETPGGWTVQGEPIDRERWLTSQKMRELDAWTPDAAFVRDDGYAAWRVREKITAESLTRILDQWPAVRRLLA